MFNVKSNYNGIRVFSIEPVKKTNVPSGLYRPSQSYVYNSRWRSIISKLEKSLNILIYCKPVYQNLLRMKNKSFLLVIKRVTFVSRIKSFAWVEMIKFGRREVNLYHILCVGRYIIYINYIISDQIRKMAQLRITPPHFLFNIFVCRFLAN